MWSDVRHAVRSLLHRPVLTTAAVLSLALGIGVNTAIFAVFERLILRQLPVPEPARLVNVVSPGPRPGGTDISGAGSAEATFSYPLFRDLENVEASPFSGIAAHRDVPMNLTYRGDTQRGNGEVVSAGYFSTLSLQPALGRLLIADDIRPGLDARVVVLSYSYWKRRFGGNRGALNETLTINGQPATIVGVGPEGFTGTTTEWSADAFVPLAGDDRVRSAHAAGNRQDHWLYVFARLKTGVTPAQAEAQIAPRFASLIRNVEFPLVRGELRGNEPRAFLARRIVLEDGSRGGMSARRNIRLILTLLFAVTSLVLLIACANVTSLLLARGVERAQEVAVRLSLGASAAQLLRLLLIEACVLGLAGSALAYTVSFLTLAEAQSLMPNREGDPMKFEVNGSAVAFALAVGVGAGLLVGLLPAVQALRTKLVSIGGQRSSTVLSGVPRFRTSLATVQVALATALLAVTGLLVNSLINVTHEDLGIDRHQLITFGVSPALNRYTPAQTLTLFERLEDRLAGIPGVSSVSAATIPLLANGFARNTVSVQGFTAAPDADVGANYTDVGPAYFKTLGIRLLAGREFTRGDDATAPKVAIVNESFVRKFKLGPDVVGKQMALGRDRPPTIEIVGVVADAKYDSIRSREVPQFFLPYRQVDTNSLTFYLRSGSDGRATLAAVFDIMKELDAQLPVEHLHTMDEQIDEKTAPDRVLTTVSSAFAGLAIMLASIGLYALLAYFVAQRSREFGIRIAIGAAPGDVCRLIAKQVGRIVLIGVAAGVVIGGVLGRLGHVFLFGIGGIEPRLLALAAAAMAVIGFVAAAIPMRRAVHVEPTEALRAE